MSELKPIATALQNLASQTLSTPSSNDYPTRSLEAAQAAKILLGCFRAGEANDPEVYTTAIVAVLARYPAHIIREVANPITGLPAKSKFLPTVSEIRDACEEIFQGEVRAIEREAQVRRQLAERREEEERRKTHLRPSLDELKAKYGESWGLSAKPEKDSDEAERERALMRRITEANEHALLAEYERAGLEPVRSGDMLVSLSLIKSLRMPRHVDRDPAV